MSFFSDTFRKYSGHNRAGALRQTRESGRAYETRSFDVPVRENVKNGSAELKEEMSKTAEALEGIKTEVANLSGMRDSLKSFLEEKQKETAENIHTENVKVYRNVQAVVVDESAKVKESVSETASKANAAMVFAIMAFVIAVLHFAFDILCRLGVF